MHGWFQKLLKSRASSPAQHEQNRNVTRNRSVNSQQSTSLSPALLFGCSSSSSLGNTPSKPLQLPSALHSPLRWSQKYDVFLCHSSVDSDSEEARRLVTLLEAPPCSLRCFLRQRDDCPGGAVSTEICQAMQNSHLWVLLITPHFLQDEWCKYMMHQALAEGPMSNRIIPLIQNLSHSEYPQELKFYFYIDLSRNPERGFSLLHKTMLKYLEDLDRKERAVDCSMDSCCKESNTDGSSKKDELMSKCNTVIPLEVTKKGER